MADRTELQPRRGSIRGWAEGYRHSPVLPYWASLRATGDHIRVIVGTRCPRFRVFILVVVDVVPTAGTDSVADSIWPNSSSTALAVLAGIHVLRSTTVSRSGRRH